MLRPALHKAHQLGSVEYQFDCFHYCNVPAAPLVAVLVCSQAVHSVLTLCLCVCVCVCVTVCVRVATGKPGKIREFKSGQCKVRENRKSLGKFVLACTKFGQLVLRKIIEIVATRCQILRLKCTKFDFRWRSAPDPAEGAYSTPAEPLAGFKGPTSKGGEE